MKLRPNTKRAQAAIVMMFVMIALEATSLVSSILQWFLLQDMKRGDINFDRINANDAREGIIAIIFTIAYIATAVVFIRWFRRAYFNLHQRVSNLRYTEGWAAGAWFIPIFNWFGPYNIFKDLFTQSSNILQSKGVTLKTTLNMNVVNVQSCFGL